MKNHLRNALLTSLLLLSALACLAPYQLLAQPQMAAHPELKTMPDGPLYAGDQVSFEVFNLPASLPAGTRVRITLNGKSLGEEAFAPYGMGGRSQATFFWAWDTRGLAPGDYSLTFTLLPGFSSWDETITLHPASALPPPEPQAAWKSVESQCCVIHYISGTDAERDIESLKAMADAQAADVERRLGATFEHKIPLTFLPRTLGHGGFTSNGIYVSYLDFNYAGSTATQVTHHEMVHWLDGQIGGQLRPSILQEGLAVYLSDGHFKVEPILPRAAALNSLGWYVPLRQLADSFYLSQHETGYAEAAALISYLVKTYGWQAFNDFYRNIQPFPGRSDADVIDSALKAKFGISLDQLETDFSGFLSRQAYTDLDRTDLRLTVNFYDTVRRYQREMDNSAYFLNAWLPDVPTMRQRQIVADFLRHPDSLFNRELEFLLVMGDSNLRAGNYATAAVDIRAVNFLLDNKSLFGH